MRRTEAHQGVRMIRFSEVWDQYEDSRLTQHEAGELLGMSERTFRRWCGRYQEDGAVGLLDRRLGKASGKRASPAVCDEVEALYLARYGGFTAKHFHEHLVRSHGFNFGYTWAKVFLQKRGHLAKAKRRGAHRRKREREAAARIDAASGWLAPCLASGPAGA